MSDASAGERRRPLESRTQADSWLVQIKDPERAGDPAVADVIRSISSDAQVQVMDVRTMAGGPHWLVVRMPAAHRAVLHAAFPGRLIIERNEEVQPLGAR